MGAGMMEENAKLENVVFTGQKWLRAFVKVDVTLCLTSGHWVFAFAESVIWQCQGELNRNSLGLCTDASAELQPAHSCCLGMCCV